MTRRFSVLLLAPFLLATACDDRVAMSVNDIFSGTDDTADAYPEVVYVGNSCSGTLISPSHVLTAAHCVAVSGAQSVTFAPIGTSAGEFRVVTTSGCWMRPEYAMINHGVLAPGHTLANVGEQCGVLSSGGDDMSPTADAEVLARGVDMAILLLSEPVPHPVAGIEVQRIGARSPAVVPARWVGDDGTTMAWRGHSGFAVGFGATCFSPVAGGCPGDVREGTRRWVMTSVDTTSATEISWGAAVLGEQDSGGALFDDHTSARRLVGVANLTGNPSSWAALGNDAARTWIASHLHATDPVRWDTSCRTGFLSDPAANATNDTDGDWVLDDVDTCPGVFNPCQLDALLADADGDGVADDCDACPADHAVTARLGESDPSQDVDQDGVPFACDCNDMMANFHDTDDDYIRDACDNCGRPGTRSVANTNQANCAGTGPGDACATDIDSDGVPDACDNCVPGPSRGPFTYNPSQLNCNLDVEIAEGACDRSAGPCAVDAPLPVGDACDPNPCSYTRLDAVQTDVNGTVRMVTDQLFVRGEFFSPTQTANEVAPTGFRFCRCTAPNVGNDVGSRQSCATASGCVVPTSPLVAGRAFAATEPRPAWRVMTTALTTPPLLGGSPDSTRYHPISSSCVVGTRFCSEGLPPVGVDAAFDWALWATDVGLWSGIYGPDAAPTDPLLPSYPGVIWTHSPVDTVTRERRSHYESGSMAAELFIELPARAFVPLPVVDCRGRLGCTVHLRWTVASAPPAPRVALIGNQGAVPADDLFPSAPALAATDLAWTHLSEPVELLRPEQTARFVGSSLDGTRIADVLHLTPYGYTPRAWHPACPNGPNCPPPKCDTTHTCFGASAGLAALAAPEPDPFFVLSASRNELFVIATNVEAVHLGTSVRRLVATDRVTLGPVRAATYDVISDRVYVIDEVSRGRGWHSAAEARLVAIEADGSGASVLASWPRTPSITRFALGPGMDGTLYLATSGEHGGWHVASFRIVHHAPQRHHAAWDEVDARTVARGEGVLASQTAYATRFAVSFLVQRPDHVEVASYTPVEHGRRERGDDDEPLHDCF